MNGFLLECLYSTGWRRGGEIYWRLQDATTAGRRLLNSHRIRAARILPVSVAAQAVTVTTLGQTESDIADAEVAS